jgi:tetratricopeptide (TPR) repeat protein
MMTKKIMLFLIVLFLPIMPVRAQEKVPFQPMPVESVHFKSAVGAFGVEMQKKEIYYFLVLDIIKPFDKEVFAEIHYENPLDKLKSIIEVKTVQPEDKKLELHSVPVTGLVKNIEYEVAISVYADREKTRLITEHVQKIKAFIDQRYLADIDEVVARVLTGEYDLALDIFKAQKMYTGSFQGRACFTLLDDFKQGKISEEYVKHFFHGLSCHYRKDFIAGIEEFKQAIAYKDNYPEAYFFLGFEYISLGQGKEAIPYLEKTITLKPDYAEALWGLATIYNDLGEKNKEKAYLLQAKSAFELQDNMDAASTIGRRLEELGQKTDGCEVQSRETSDAFEEGESLAACPDEIRYSHHLFNFNMTLPPTWTQVRMTRRKTAELGKIASIAFMPSSEAMGSGVVIVRVHLKMQQSPVSSLDDALARNMEVESHEEGFKVEGSPEKIKVTDIDALRYVFSEGDKRMSCVIILHGGYLYELNFGLYPLESYDKFYPDFEKMVQSIKFQ